MPWSESSTSTNAANCGTEPGRGQHYRVAGLNLLAAIIIYWNTLKLGNRRLRKETGRARQPNLPINKC